MEQDDDPLVREMVDLAVPHTLEFLYGAPEYGGNRDLVGWRTIDFEGDTQPRGYTRRQVVHPESTGPLDLVTDILGTDEQVGIALGSTELLHGVRSRSDGRLTGLREGVGRLAAPSPEIAEQLTRMDATAAALVKAARERPRSTGGEAVLFFQWRASRAGAEKFHSGLVPHAGTDTKVWREVVELSRTLDRIEEVAGSGARNHVAMLFDWQCWWAAELDSHPTQDLTYLDRAHAVYRALWGRGVGVDFLHPEQDLTGYDLVVVPTLYSVTNACAEAVKTAVEAGATALVTYFSGIVDENDHVRLGGCPGAFRDLLGIMVEEFAPLREGERVRLSDGSSADMWTEHLHLCGAESLATYEDGPLLGVPALTRHGYGAGTAWYVACRLDDAGTSALVDRVLELAGVAPTSPTVAGVEVARRTAHDGRSWLFILNHTGAATVEADGHDLVADQPVDGNIELPAGGVAVVREH